MLQVSNSFNRFLDESESRVARFLCRALWYQNSGREVRNRWATLMITSKEVNYLTLREDSTISYLPKGKEHVVNDEGRWARDNRQNGRPASIIRKVLTKNALKLFKDSEFEAFVNEYKSECDKETKKFVIRENKDIPEVYCMTRERGGGTLNDSCMNNDREYVEMYAHCPSVRILCLMNTANELAGRALLWTLPDGNTLVDRMYVAQDHYYDMFIDHAIENGWMYKKKYKTYCDGMDFMLNGEHIQRSYKITTPTDFNYYPYIDTFRYGCDGWISNDDCSSYSYVYNCSSGGREGDNRSECAIDGEFYDDDDLRHIERGRYSGYCIHIDRAVYCETDRNWYYYEDESIVNIDDHWYRNDDDDICYSEYNSQWYMRDDCEYSDYDNDYFLADDCVYSNHHSSFIRTDEAYEVAGEYFHESVVNKVA